METTFGVSQIVNVEAQTWEAMMSRFEAFTQRVETLCEGQDKSLQKIYGILFSEKISKSQRLSNWEADVLTDAQKQYAATDAWACLNIYHLLEELKRTGNYELAPEEEATEKVKVGSDQQ